MNHRNEKKGPNELPWSSQAPEYDDDLVYYYYYDDPFMSDKRETYLLTYFQSSAQKKIDNKDDFDYDFSFLQTTLTM